MEAIIEDYEETDDMDLDDFADISNILAEHDELEKLMPFYKNFTGKIYPDENGYIVEGVVIQKDSKEIHITELPI